ncbi:MAG: sigma-70 family RNA polymerase sigma factor [Planctomycetes bacterium]|nr:sigma-70 family RNA polymerase sigma factor [Planctomycetota bacterium]
MANYHHAPMAELVHQLTLSPVRLRLKQLDAIEHLVDVIEPDKSYPYDFICNHITEYTPRGGLQRTMQGKTLIEDLVQMVEELSSSPVLPAGIFRPCYTTEELATRLKVSTKTVCRWRRRGLPGRKLRYADGTVRMAFLDRNVVRFVARHRDLVQRGAAFKQLTEDEKQRIVDLARSILDQRRVRLHELSQMVAAQVGRAVETVRYTLRRYDHAHPKEALFGRGDQPLVAPEMMAVYDLVAAGTPLQQAAVQSGRSESDVRSIVREVRARSLAAREIPFVYNAEFETPGADRVILGRRDGTEAPRPRRIQPPKDLPPYLQDLYRQPLFTPEQERDMFRRYNYVKFKADRLRKKLDVTAATDLELDAIDSLLAESDRLKNEILRANLRLVVSIARRHVGRSSCFFEVVSDGNLSLMRAVEKFDYSRGFKFSTYASWAIMRNYARSIPEQMYQATKLVTGSDEALAVASAPDTVSRDTILEGARHLVQKGLQLLTARERDIVVRHYGLDDQNEPMTLDQIGGLFGVTKERVRQIERKAIAKLRQALGEGQEEFVEA